MNGDDETTREIVNGFVRDVSFGDLMRGNLLEAAAEEEEEDSSDSYESSSEFESATDDDETATEESTQGPSLPSTTPQRAQEPFPSSQPKLAFPLATKSSSPSQGPSVASSSSAGSRLRKLSLTLRKSKSMTLGPTRSSPSNNTEAPPPLPPLPPPPPPVPPLPQSVTKSRSTVPLAADRANSKPLPATPQSQSPSSPYAIRSPTRRTRTPSTPQPPNTNIAQKPHPTNQIRKSSQAAPKGQGKQAASETLKPPQLKKISELLPIFVEMVRCHNSNRVFLFFYLLISFFFPFVRCAHRYAHGDGLMDNQLVILALDQPAIELGYEYSILLGFNVKRTLYGQFPFWYEFFLSTMNPTCKRRWGILVQSRYMYD
jgi:hypothetical protein